jgi:hypothetical protein
VTKYLRNRAADFAIYDFERGRVLAGEGQIAFATQSYGGRMSKLTSKARDQLPASEFAGPGRSYPIPDKAHAVDAKARASQAVKAGRLSQSEAKRIDAKADTVLEKSKKK